MEKGGNLKITCDIFLEIECVGGDGSILCP